MTRRSIVLLLFCCWLPLAAYAAGNPIQFSADAVQQAPQRPDMIARMFVGSQGVRTEYEVNGQPVVEIVFTSEGRRLVMFPQYRSYMEQAGGKPIDMGVPKDTNPCATQPGATCTRMGEEKINGRDTEKWEVTRNVEGRSVRSLHWIDKERKLPVREFFADGTVSELHLLGQANVSGRNTEKWELVINTPDGKTITSQQWYDTQLHLTIREEMEGGFVREMRNIKVAAQPAALFRIPAGYQKVSQPPFQPPAPQQR
jgi:hypothetical protein